ncbi:MAG: cation/acetate symporter ActP [Gammaproteobacteria bacterium]|nr:cation/acetate symporter ActP [Gammaproteobacteria bacterium]
MIVSRFSRVGTALYGLLVSAAALADEPVKGTDKTAIAMFFVFIAITLGITYWAAGRTKTTKDFYAAGGNIKGWQNGLAITGDWCSAAAFLGISGLIYTGGFDGLIYSVPPFAAWPLMMFLFADRLRNLGKYTIADIISLRFSRVPTRTLVASAGLVFVVTYIIAQMVGAGKLVSFLFHIRYEYAVCIVGALIIVYVAFGGMLATTWVQLIKAVLLLSGASFITFMVLKHFDFSMSALYKTAIDIHPKGLAIMSPGLILTDPVSSISLGLAMLFGATSLPHVLMRFFTVPNAKEARKSAFFAATFIGYFYLLTFVIGYGAIVFVTKNPQFLDAGGLIVGGDNMSAIYLAKAVGGDVFLGFISAVAFATIVAVVAGLTIAGASAISHDLYANVFRHGKVTEGEVVKVSRIAALALGFLAVLLGILFEKQNIAYMVVLPFTISSTVFFPLLFLSMYWKRLTTKGVVWGGWTGLLAAVAMLILGPTIWKDILHHAAPIFPYKYPTLFSMTTSFAAIIIFSLLDKSARAKQEIASFDDQFVRSQTGLGAEAPTQH